MNGQQRGSVDETELQCLVLLQNITISPLDHQNTVIITISTFHQNRCGDAHPVRRR